MKRDRDLWIKYISERSLPMFGCSAQSVLALSADNQISLKVLAESVGRDAVLAARVLQIANSEYYNRDQKPITNIKRAILHLGFNKLYEICLTVSFIDGLINEYAPSHLVNLMARSFHAAIQARTLAEQLEVAYADEIYIATLFYRLGEIAFWSLSGKISEKQFIEYSELANLPQTVQESLLGVTFKQITFGLIEEWNLSRLLQNTLFNPNFSTRDATCIHYGLYIADNLDEQNYTEKYRAVVGLVADDLGVKVDLVSVKIRENIHQVADTFKLFCQNREISGHSCY